VKAIHNPLPMCWAARERMHERRNLITYVGRLHPVKRIDEFLVPLIDVLDANTELEAVIVGAGECEATLKRIANGHPRVHFISSMTSADVMNTLARTKVFFSGCDTEAFGISLLEAAVSGCNVVTTASGGFMEVILEDVNRFAFLVAPNFSGAECRAALEMAIAAPARHLVASPFLPASIAKQYLAVASAVTEADQ
jgi:glycosyltransferase involved in cell wall biosynthesis